MIEIMNKRLRKVFLRKSSNNRQGAQLEFFMQKVCWISHPYIKICVECL